MAESNKNQNISDAESKVKRLRAFESIATIGLLFLAIGLVAPFTNFENGTVQNLFKWVYASGALIYFVARVAGGYDPSDTLRVKRLRRMEIWAGVAFGIGTFFWFYNSGRYSGFPMTLGMMRDTVVFTLVGAVLQIVASWMIIAAKRKEAGNT